MLNIKGLTYRTPGIFSALRFRYRPHARLKLLLYFIGIACTAVVTQPLYAESLNTGTDDDALLAMTWDELERQRPANSFNMVYAEDKQICQTILNALNEQGYDPEVYHSSPDIYHPLPELLLQTRLNLPRKLLGTHLFRTEEYEINYTDKTGTPQTDYWYRFIGLGYDELALGYEVKESYTVHHTVPYTDFIQFRWEAFPLTQSTCGDCVFGLKKARRYDYWKNEIFNQWAFDAVDNKSHTFSYFDEIVTVNKEYFILSTLAYPEQDKPLRVVASPLNRMRAFQQWAYGERSTLGICFMKSRFILQGIKNE